MVLHLVKALFGVALAREGCVCKAEVVVLWLVPGDISLVAWNVEVLVCNWGTLYLE